MRSLLNSMPDFPQQHIGEETARHADAAMDAPDRQFDALGQQGIVPGEHVIIDAVDQRAVEIEQKSGLRNRHGGLLHPVLTATDIRT